MDSEGRRDEQRGNKRNMEAKEENVGGRKVERRMEKEEREMGEGKGTGGGGREKEELGVDVRKGGEARERERGLWGQMLNGKSKGRQDVGM